MKKNDSTLLLGAHMSISGGFAKAIERGASIGCTAIQVFTKSNRQWGAKALNDEEVAAFGQAQKAFNIHHIIAHATYLINLGSPDPATSKKSTLALIDEVSRCHALSIPYLVVHPGSHVGTDEESCLKRIAHNINEILNSTPSTTSILVENMAGQGSVVCYSFEHIAFILSNVNDRSRIGVCFDTAHAFAAGYDFRNPKGYESLWQQFDDVIGLQHLKAMHINDSKKDLGTHVDRHEDIGKGALGLEPFRFIFNDPRFSAIPKILETPKESLADDERNMETIKNLIV